ncbi:MAG TPA: signal peptidase I [Symbiobacteriaceae bacterium]
MNTLTRLGQAAILLLLLLILATHGFVLLCTRPSTDGISAVAGYKVLHVISGSMEPALRMGDVILVRPLVPEDDIREGDVITFRAREGTALITHRVVGIVTAGGQPVGYVTKGDANAAPDALPVAREQVVGRCIFRIPLLGYVSRWVRRPTGILLTIILPGLLLSGRGLPKP